MLDSELRATLLTIQHQQQTGAASQGVVA